MVGLTCSWVAAKQPAYCRNTSLYVRSRHGSSVSFVLGANILRPAGCSISALRRQNGTFEPRRRHMPRVSVFSHSVIDCCQILYISDSYEPSVRTFGVAALLYEGSDRDCDKYSEGYEQY